MKTKFVSTYFNKLIKESTLIITFFLVAFFSTAQDTSPPVIQSLSPNDEAADVTLDEEFVITFDEDVFFANLGGTIYARQKTDNQAVTFIALSQATFSGNQIIFKFNDDLPPSSDLFISIDAGKIQDASGNTFLGISDSEIWDFATLNTPFVTTWKTDNPGITGDNQIRIPTFGSGYNYVIDWGDDSKTTGTSTNPEHTYEEAGTYTVSIYGDFPQIYFNGQWDEEKILSIEQWGDNSWRSMHRAFRGCINMVGNATDVPDLTNVSSLSSAFFQAEVYNAPMNNWDVSNVTDMSFVFTAARIFNQPLNNWDVSSVTTTSSMFSGAQAFDQPLDSWDVSKVTNMSFMFVNASVFDQSLEAWDVGEVLFMQSMFSNAREFNQPLNGWNVSKVTDMNRMFNNAVSFNQPLGEWDVSTVSAMDNMFNNSDLRTPNYDATLIGWSSLTPQPGVRLGASFINYCNSMTERAVLTGTFNWIITDGSSNCNNTWNGTEWSFGVSPDENEAAKISASFTFSEDGTFACGDLFVDSGITLAVDGDNLLEVTGDIVNQGSLIIESGSSLITYESGDVIFNDITIKRNTRYSDGKYSFVGTPVEQDASITGNDLGTNVYKYNEAIAYGVDGINRWEDASLEQLESGKGYTQANQQEIIFNGVPNTGTITYSGTYTEDTDDANEGWNLVANPYTAAINVTDFLAANTNTSGSVYIWDDNGSDTQRGTNADYIVANGTMATNTTAAGGQTRYNQAVGSAQGFFVKLNDNTDTEITFDEDMRLGSQNSDDNFFRETTFPIARINLTNNDGLFKQAVIGLSEDAENTTLNRTYDAQAFNATTDHGLFTIKAGRSLSLNGMTQDWEVIQLHMNTKEAGIYQISVELEGYDQSIYLKDNMTGDVIDLRNESYSFSSQAGIDTDRFELISNPNRVLGLEDEEVLIYANNNVLHIRPSDNESREYQLFNMQGRKLMTIDSNGNKKVNLQSFQTGVYLVFDGQKTHKIILK